MVKRDKHCSTAENQQKLSEHKLQATSAAKRSLHPEKSVIKMPSIRKMMATGGSSERDNTRAVRFMDNAAADAV